MKKSILCAILAVSLSTAQARTWTSTDGKTVEAEVVKVNPDRTVKLKTSNHRMVTVPFDSFSETDVEYLEMLLVHPDGLSPIPWEKMNELIGFPLWNDNNLWDDPCSEVAKRIEIKKESETDFMENYRAYPLGLVSLFGEPVYAQALYGDKEQTESLSLVFLNLGDVPEETDPNEIEDRIEDCGKRVLAAIKAILGEPQRDSIGKDALREKIWRWDWNDHAILLSLQEGKYTAVRIMTSDRADQAGRVNKLSDAELRKRMASCVEHRPNGDVIIRNIPMINQGPKGYCMPATWERYLRYMDIPADMYLLALAANTGIGGGTYTEEMTKATGNIIHSNGRKLGSCGEIPDMKTVADQVDKGLPILWTLLSTPAFQRTANDNTARHYGQEVAERPAGQDEDTTPGGHICLIIGYNKKTGEIAISDSWGPRFTERWVPEEEIKKVSYGTMNIIKW